MRIQRIVLLLLALLLLPLASPAQDLNEELWAAARKGNVEAVKALLAKGVDVNAKTQYGATALSYAADKGHTEVVRVLLEHGADVNVRDKFYGATPIVWASNRGYTDIVTALLDKGADGKDDALTIGVSEGHIDIVKVVLDRGGVKAETLSAALTRALKNKRNEIAELLKKAGATPAPMPDFKVDTATLKTYEGTYKDKEDREWRFTSKDGKLFGGAVTNPLTWGAFNKTTFKPDEFEGLTVVFNVEGERVVGFTLKRDGNDLIFMKVEAK